MTTCTARAIITLQGAMLTQYYFLHPPQHSSFIISGPLQTRSKVEGPVPPYPAASFSATEALAGTPPYDGGAVVPLTG